jgi:hypothetical protein
MIFCPAFRVIIVPDIFFESNTPQGTPGCLFGGISQNLLYEKNNPESMAVLEQDRVDAIKRHRRGNPRGLTISDLTHG